MIGCARETWTKIAGLNKLMFGIQIIILWHKPNLLEMWSDKMDKHTGFPSTARELSGEW